MTSCRGHPPRRRDIFFATCRGSTGATSCCDICFITSFFPFCLSFFLSFSPIALGGFNRQWAALSNIYAGCSLPPYTHSHGAPGVCVMGNAPSFCSYLVWSEPVLPGWRAEGGQPAPYEDSPGFLLVWEACSGITKRGPWNIKGAGRRSAKRKKTRAQHA